ncbi:MAG: glycosyltransferase family 4 protein [Gaiella sp.]
MSGAGGRVGRYARAGRRWGSLLASRRYQGLRLSYGHDVVPGPEAAVSGGTAKFQRLQERFPNHPTDFTVLYLGSSWLPRDLEPLLWAARRRGAPVVVNQNGVGYPAWAGERTRAVNRPLRLALEAATHVLYQSAFSKSAADAWLGPAPGSWEILSNAVDVDRFRPAVEPPPGGPVLLLGGDQTQTYRVELALRTLALVRREHPDARLVVTGRLVASPEPLIRELGVHGAVELVGRYTQAEAVALFQRSHLLLHTQMNDNCPSLVLEAMACGLPVVYCRSGGTPELVGDEAGIGVPHDADWDRLVPPPPEALAEAVARGLGGGARLGAAGRRRVEENYALPGWLSRHEQLLAELLNSGSSPRPRSRPT